MATIKDICEYDGFEPKCLFCGYDEYTICLTAHHLFPKDFFKPQPSFDREDRYIILCPTCHALLHRGVFVGNGEQIMLDKIEHCALKYSNQRNIDNIIKLVKMVYAIAYKPKSL